MLQQQRAWQSSLRGAYEQGAEAAGALAEAIAARPSSARAYASQSTGGASVVDINALRRSLDDVVATAPRADCVALQNQLDASRSRVRMALDRVSRLREAVQILASGNAELAAQRTTDAAQARMAALGLGASQIAKGAADIAIDLAAPPIVQHSYNAGQALVGIVQGVQKADALEIAANEAARHTSLVELNGIVTATDPGEVAKATAKSKAVGKTLKAASAGANVGKALVEGDAAAAGASLTSMTGLIAAEAGWKKAGAVMGGAGDIISGATDLNRGLEYAAAVARRGTGLERRLAEKQLELAVASEEASRLSTELRGLESLFARCQ